MSRGQTILPPPTAARLLTLFLVALILDVGGAFGIKYLAAILIVLFLIFKGDFKRFPLSDFTVEGVLFAVIPALLVLISLFWYGIEPESVIRHSLFLATWLLLPIALSLPVGQTTERFNQILTLAAGLVLTAFVLQVALAAADQQDLILQIRRFFNQNRMGMVGPRPIDDASGYVPGVYFRWSMLLITACVLSLAGAAWRTCLIVLGVLATTSSGVIFFAFAGSAGASLVSASDARKRLGLIALLVAFVVLTSILVGYAPVLDWVVSKFSPDHPGSARKMSQVADIADLLSTDVSTFLLGTGIGSTFHSTFLDRRIVTIEVSQADLARQFGVPYAICFFAYVLWVGVRLIGAGSQRALWGIGLLAFFCATATNPILLSPVFFSVLALARAGLQPDPGSRPDHR